MSNKLSTFIGILAITSVGAVGFQLAKTDKFTDPVPGSCTIFSAAVGDKVLFGNNEDFYNPNTYVWTEPATSKTYGCIYVGFSDYSHQGGMNEKGLCFDANALPGSALLPHAELAAPPTYDPPYEDYEIWAPVLILQTAATVEEVIDIAGKYQRSNWYPKSGSINYQLNFADATGDAVVISVDNTGELAFTRKKQDAIFLISTNFNKANPENALEYPCERYFQAEKMLQGITTEEDLTVDYFQSILESVHERGIFNTTLYSTIFDLTNGIVYLYHWHQFGEVAVLNVAEELVKGETMVRIKDLFSPETVGNASREYYGYIILLCISTILGTGAVIGLIRYLKRRHGPGLSKE